MEKTCNNCGASPKRYLSKGLCDRCYQAAYYSTVTKLKRRELSQAKQSVQVERVNP